MVVEIINDQNWNDISRSDSFDLFHLPAVPGESRGRGTLLILALSGVSHDAGRNNAAPLFLPPQSQRKEISPATMQSMSHHNGYLYCYLQVHWWEVNYFEGAWGQGPVQRRLTDINVKLRLFFQWSCTLLLTGGFGMKRTFRFVFSPWLTATLAAGRGHAGMLANPIYSGLKHPQHQRYLQQQQRSNTTQVICTVWSPGRADTSDHTGWVRRMLWQDLPPLLPRPVSTVNQNASDVRFIEQGRLRKTRVGTACQALIGE